MECLTASPSPWSDRLEVLKVQHNIAVPDFVRAASQVMWPSLKTINLLGAVDGTRANDDFRVEVDDMRIVAGTTGRSTFEALTAALPSMPKVARVQITVIMNSTRRTSPEAFEIGMQLGSTPRAEKGEKDGKILHCGDKFVPGPDRGVVKVEGICIPGDLAGQMQDTLRNHRRLELEVFACAEECYDYHTWPLKPCVQWNRWTDSWDLAVHNGLDVLIYEMGRYWEIMHGPDRWL